MYPGDRILVSTIISGSNILFGHEIEGKMEVHFSPDWINTLIFAQNVIMDKSKTIKTWVLNDYGTARGFKIPVNPRFDKLRFSIDPVLEEIDTGITFSLQNTNNYSTFKIRYEWNWENSRGKTGKETLRPTVAANSTFNISRDFSESGIYNVSVTVFGPTCSWTSNKLQVEIVGKWSSVFACHPIN